MNIEQRMSIFLPLYEQGLNDIEVAELWKVSREYVRQVRNRCKLPIQTAKHVLCENLYSSGRADEEIAEITGRDIKVIKRWRQRTKKINLRLLELREKILGNIVILNNAGISDGKIAKQLETSPENIRRYRNKLGLMAAVQSRNPKYRKIEGNQA